MAIRPRNVGELLDGAVRLYRQDMGLYMLTAIAASLPVAIVGILGLTGGESTGAAIAIVLVALVAVVATVSVWTALMIQMNDRLEGREPRLGPAVTTSLALFFRVVWGAFLAYVALVGVMIICGGGAVVVGIALGSVGSELVVGIGALIVGIALAVWLGVQVFSGLCLFLPGIVVERLTAYQSIKRGFALAKGGQFRILGVVVLSWILIFVPFSAVYVLTGTATTIFDPEAVSSGVVSTSQIVVQQLLGVIASGFTTPFMVACILLLYYDQRVRREAYDLQAEADALAN